MMSTANDLLARLLEHAAIHDAATSPYDDEQAQWAQDLRDASVLVEAERWRAAEMNSLRESDRHIDSLLAFIHSDGGHYRFEHGTAKACKEAIRILKVRFAEAAAELERIAEPAATHTSLGHENGAERLCRILYGRGAEIGDTIGGLDAQMLHDAAAELERMRKAVLPEDD